MKVNILTGIRGGGNFASTTTVRSTITGEIASGPNSFEDEIIDSIDNSRMSPQKLIVKQFLLFLENHKLNMTTLKMLTVEEQLSLKKEFLEE